MMSSLQEECDRLREAAENGDIDAIKILASSGVDVINADVGKYVVSKFYMLHWVTLLVVLCINWCDDNVMVDEIKWLSSITIISLMLWICSPIL